MNLIRLFSISLAAIMLAGCSSWSVSDTPRTAIEQLLLSTATDRAVVKMNLSPLKDKTVYFDDSNMESYDEEYTIGSIRDQLLRQGANLVNSKNDAEIIVEGRVGALANDKLEMLFGLPSIEIPVPSAGGLKSPEIPIFKRMNQQGISKLVVLARKNGTGEFIFSTGAKSGLSYYNRWWFLTIPFQKTNIPEKREGQPRL